MISLIQSVDHELVNFFVQLSIQVLQHYMWLFLLYGGLIYWEVPNYVRPWVGGLDFPWDLTTPITQGTCLFTEEEDLETNKHRFWIPISGGTIVIIKGE